MKTNLSGVIPGRLTWREIDDHVSEIVRRNIYTGKPVKVAVGYDGALRIGARACVGHEYGVIGIFTKAIGESDEERAHFIDEINAMAAEHAAKVP